MHLSCTPPPPPPPPQLTFEAASFDYGNVDQGTMVTHEFSFHNGGGAALFITNLKTASDVQAAAKARAIPSGGRSTITVQFDTTHVVRKGGRTVTVYSNDPAQPVVTLTLSGTVTFDVVADPPALYLGRIARGAKNDNDVRVLTGGRFRLSVKENTNRVVRASLAPSIDGATVAVSIAPDAPLGRFRESVIIQTTSAKHPALSVPVIGVVEPQKD